jgi:molybdenum cofactor cytidylyltransferase
MIYAVIPAAGKSIRMGRPKLALPIGDRTVLEHVIGTVRAAGVEHILVVVGPHAPELAPLAESSGAHVLMLSEETRDMRATIEYGLRWIEDRHQPDEKDYWLLLPADLVGIDPKIVRVLLRRELRQGRHSILVPTFGGTRGHPVLISWKHVAGIRALPLGLGLDAYLRRFSTETLEMPVSSSGVVFDLDTPKDYEEFRQQCKAPKTEAGDSAR